eukprot:s653_g22.t2
MWKAPEFFTVAYCRTWYSFTKSESRRGNSSVLALVGVAVNTWLETACQTCSCAMRSRMRSVRGSYWQTGWTPCTACLLTAAGRTPRVPGQASKRGFCSLKAGPYRGMMPASKRQRVSPRLPVPSEVSEQAEGEGASEAQASSDWRMVLYHDRNVVLFNPGEKPAFRSRRLSVDEAAPGTELSNRSGRCPLCRQTVDARFAFAAQAYFDLLQGLFRSGTRDPEGEDIDLLAESDLYRILGLPRSAKADDIKRAYRKRSLRFHPDKNPDDPDAKLKFQKVAEAFTVLSDENKRAKYDNSGDMDLEGFDVETFMEMVNAAGLKFQKQDRGSDERDGRDDFPEEVPSRSAMDRLAGLGVSDEEQGDAIAIGDGDYDANPFLLGAEASNPAEVPIFASEGGAEAQQAAAAALRHLPAGLLNTGYYVRFFQETKLLGSGSFGAVYLCRHVLDDMMLGDYAVKKVPVGDNKVWLRDMVREDAMSKRKLEDAQGDGTRLSQAGRPPLVFHLEATCGRARAATVTLPHGDVLTPVFMPVGTQGTIKGMSSEDMEMLGCRILLGNTFHLANRPTCELLRKCGGLHKLMNWNGNILTDSGGFQMVSLLKLAVITEDGVEFEDPKKPGSRMLLTPEKSIESQNDIGADIMMALDDVVSSTLDPVKDEARIKEATDRTLRWIDRCIKAHRNPEQQNLFGIVQGHLDVKDGGLRDYSLKEMIRRDLPGYAIGGLSGGEAKSEFWRVVERCTRPQSGLPPMKPRYLMGVGYPLDIVICVALGVDMFDCVYPCRTARFGTALVRSGQLRLTSAEFASDYRPLEPDRDGNGQGPLKDYTRAMLYTIVTKEPVAAQLITLHNLWFMLNLLQEMRQQIKSGTFPDWVRRFLQDFFPMAKPAPCEHCPPRWVKDALDLCGIAVDDLFDWSEPQASDGSRVHVAPQREGCSEWPAATSPPGENVKTFERLHHPNIVEYKHSWLELSRRSEFCPFVPFLFILMQYCNGGSLAEQIWHDGNSQTPKDQMPTEQIWHFLLDILLGLQHLHRQGILHRDLKPTNILLSWPDNSNRGAGSEMFPRALLSDFGTAQAFGEPPASATAAASRGYTGTVEYTAPELLLMEDFEREYSEKSDMWPRSQWEFPQVVSCRKQSEQAY